MNIYLFGCTSIIGEAFIKQFDNEFLNKYIYLYSRTSKGSLDFDLNKPESFKIVKDEESFVIISFAPIWLLSNFLRSILESNPNRLSNLKGVIACSSSSAVTKRFSGNTFDKELYSKLIKSEDIIIAISTQLEIPCKIIRPTMVYGRIGEKQDKNISKLLNLMRRNILLPIPSETGERQPIHAYQLAKVFKLFFYKLCNNDLNYFDKTILSVGGDFNISYGEMLKAIRDSTEVSDSARKCIFIYIPNRIFFLLVSPVVLLSPRFYSALLRISANLSGFTPSHKILNSAPLVFPLKLSDK